MADLEAERGLLRATIDPFVNAVHVCLLRERHGQKQDIRKDFETAREKLLDAGPKGVTAEEKLMLLSDPETLEWLHQQLWSRDPEALAPWWRQALRFHESVELAA
jgi:membrane glycosyltransferase